MATYSTVFKVVTVKHLSIKRNIIEHCRRSATVIYTPTSAVTAFSAPFGEAPSVYFEFCIVVDSTALS